MAVCLPAQVFCRGLGFPPALARAWAVGLCSGGCVPHCKASDFRPRRSRMEVIRKVWKFWPERDPENRASSAAPKPKAFAAPLVRTARA